MWLYDRRMILLGATALGACGFTPVYGPQGGGGALADQAKAKGIRVLTGHGIAKVQGRKRVTGVAVCKQVGEGAVTEEIACDAVAMSGGWSPVVHLWSHCGGKLIWDERRVMFRPDPEGLPSTLVGQMAPALPEKPLEGFPAAAPDVLTNGEVTLVNVWASWCAPCRQEHPLLMQLAGDDRFRIVGLNYKDDPANARRFLGELGSPYDAIGVDANGRTAINWGVTAPPETFLIAGDGTVLFRYAGPLVGSDYEQRFLPALQDALKN